VAPRASHGGAAASRSGAGYARTHRLAELLLRSQLARSAARLLAAVRSAGGEACVALAADLLVAVGFASELSEGRINRHHEES
jgi:hypothetical protein